MQMQKMNYWERQKSFWKTPAGLAIWFVLLVAILGGGLLALNRFVSPYPVIESFDADPAVIRAGEATNLSWSVIGASDVFLDHGIGQIDLKGFERVMPSETTIYELAAVNGSRNRSMQVKVMVHPQDKT
jgi:hypothetical protein